MSRKNKKETRSKKEREEVEKPDNTGEDTKAKETESGGKDKQNEAPNPGFVESLRGAILEPAMYNTFLRVKLKSSISLLGILLLLMSVVLTMNWARQESEWLDQFAAFYDSSLPTIHVKDGKAQVKDKVDMPLKVNYKNQMGNTLIIIDTTGKTKEIKDVEGVDRICLLTGDSLMYRINGGSTNTAPLSEFAGKDGQTINGDFIRGVKKGIVANMMPMLILTWILFGAFILAVQVGIFGLLAKTMSRFLEISLNFREAANLVIYASIPAILFFALAEGLGLSRLLGNYMSVVNARMTIFIIYYLILSGYLITAMGAVKKKTAAEE